MHAMTCHFRCGQVGHIGNIEFLALKTLEPRGHASSPGSFRKGGVDQVLPPLKVEGLEGLYGGFTAL